MLGLQQLQESDIPPPSYALESAPISEIVSRNSMTIFRTNYGRFCAKYDTLLPRQLVPKIRWIVCDRAKFGGLINALKEIVDDLFSLLKLERSVHEEAIELDILNNNNLSELRLVEDAAEASSYPAFAIAVSIAIDRTEAGTVHRENLAASKTPLITGLSGPVTSNQLLNQKTGQISLWYLSLSDAKLFFMVTPECRSYVGSCIDEDFETWSHKDGYESFTSPEAISMRMLRRLNLSDCLHHYDLDADLSNARKVGEDGESREVETLASISIFVAPCLRLVRTATNICHKATGSKARLLSFHIHVDDRLNCSCSDSERNKHRISALVKYWRESNNSGWVYLQDRLNLTRMERRVYDFQQELPPLASVPNLDDLFAHSENRVDVTMPVAAVLVIGEDQETVRLFRELSLEQEPRMPTALSFYQIVLPRWGVGEGRRHFLGSYRLEANLKARVSAPTASNLASQFSFPLALTFQAGLPNITNIKQQEAQAIERALQCC